MTTPEVNWEDPPKALRGPQARVWWLRLEPLMQKPGKWARVYETTARGITSISSNLRRRHLVYPQGKWEFTSRTVGEHGRLYARYLGPDEEIR